MPGGYGSSKNGVRVGVFWDGISVTGGTAKITDPRVAIDRDVNISDTSNSLSISGGAVTDDSWSNLNCSGSGEERIKNVSAQTVTLKFGSTVSYNFEASLSGINYAGGTLTVSKSVTYPARPYTVPNPPTIGTSGRTGVGEGIQVNWTNNPSGGTDTEKPYSSLVVDRLVDAETAWTQVSLDLSNATTSWPDPATSAGHRYKYRVRAKNSAGSSVASAETPWIYTTPVAPTNTLLSKSGTDITVTWTPVAAYYTGTRITPNRGAVDTTAYTVAAPTATWADPAENAGVVQYYKLQHYIDSPLAAGGTTTLYSAIAQSESVQLAGPPRAPKDVKVSVSVTDVADAVTLSWTHDPIDASPQSKYGYQSRYSTDGGTTWVPSSGFTVATEVASAANSVVLPGLVNGRLYEFQVRTYSTSTPATPGPYSGSVQLQTSGKPTATVVTPASGAIITAPALTLTLGYTDPEASSPAEWQVHLYDNLGVQIWPGPEDPQTLPGNTNQTPFTVPYSLEHGKAYSVKVAAKDAAGLWSALSAAYNYTVTFAPPVTAQVFDTVCRTDVGAVDIWYTLPQAVPGTSVDAVIATVQRLTDGDWVDVCTKDGPFTGVTNPSFETAGAATEAYRNYCVSPQGNNNWQTSFSTNGAGTVTYPADARFKSGFAARMAWTTASSSHSGGYIFAPGPAVAIGEVWTFSMRIAATNLQGPTPQIKLNPAHTRTAEGVIDHGDGSKTYWLTATFTAAGTASCIFGYFGGLLTTVVLAGDCLITKTRNRAEFFIPGITANVANVAQINPTNSSDGDYVSAAWTGSQNQSASTVTMAPPTPATMVHANMLRVQSGKWAMSGTKSLRIIPVGAVTDTYADIEGGSGGIRLGMEPGRTYTVMATCRLTAAQVSPSLNARRIKFIYQIGSNGYVEVLSPQALNQAGVTDLKLTFTVPLGATEAFIRLMNGASAGNGEVWWDNFLLTEGVYEGAYTDAALHHCRDSIPPLGAPVQYRVETESATPTYAVTAPYTVDCTLEIEECCCNEGMILFLNGGPDWSVQARLVGNPAVSLTREREKVLVTPVGRSYPIELLGDGITEQYKLSGVVSREADWKFAGHLKATMADWEAMATVPAPLCYRDPFGTRKFVSIGGVDTSWGTTPIADVSTTMTVVSGGETG